MPAMTDYYNILGVQKNDDAKTIKSAYRKLARKYHPDVNPGDASAEQKFGEINQAYEVLSDPEKRKLYDRFGPDFEKYQQAGANFGGSGFGGFQGNRGDVQFNFQDMGDIFNMFSGGGMGGFRQQARPRQPQPLEHEISVSLQELLHGTSRTLQFQTARGVQSIDVKIPAGLKPGSQLKVGGKGDLASNQKILITVQVEPEDDIEISGANFTQTVPLNAFTAMLGGTLDVPTHKGTVALKIPAGTQGGQKFRLKGFGFTQGKNTQGDLYIRVALTTPTQLTSEQRELLQRLAQEIS